MIGLMKSFRIGLVVAALTVGVGGCASYDPPVRGDHASEGYKAELEKCRTSSTETVRRKNAGTPGTWIISPFTGPGQVRAAIRMCMASKGYVLEKAGS
jgi:hypothetical protein